MLSSVALTTITLTLYIVRIAEYNFDLKNRYKISVNDEDIKICNVRNMWITECIPVGKHPIEIEKNQPVFFHCGLPTLDHIQMLSMDESGVSERW